MRTRIGRQWNSASVLGAAAAAAVGFWLGRGGPQSAAMAGAPEDAPPASASDYSQRVVAYIHGTVPITREDLGEYLIARFGYERVELLVNKRIIEIACQKANPKIDVTDAEVVAAIDADAARFGVQTNEFISQVLKQRGKTLYEWKEDVVRPGLMLTKLCRGRVTVADDDLRKSFDSTHGPKVECRIIIWSKAQEKFALMEYDKIRKSEEEFDRAARSQEIGHLAAVGGRIKPIARHAGTHPDLEKDAFSLKPGEVSRLVSVPEGVAILKCDKVIPADDKVKFDDVKEAMRKEVYEKKIEAEIPKMFKTMRDEAKPVFFLKKNTNAEDLKRDVEADLKQTGGIQQKKD